MNTKAISFISVILTGVIFSSEIRALGSDGIPQKSDIESYALVKLSSGQHSRALMYPWRYNVSLLALNNENEPAASAASSRGWNWHKILGSGTIVTALATVASGFAGYDGPHCGLAAVSTGLAAATCVNGFWTYGNIFTAGDTRLAIHAASGMLSTAGFGAAMALADGAPHGGIGAVSGAVFMVTVGVVYF